MPEAGHNHLFHLHGLEWIEFTRSPLVVAAASNDATNISLSWAFGKGSLTRYRTLSTLKGLMIETER